VAAGSAALAGARLAIADSWANTGGVERAIMLRKVGLAGVAGFGN